MGVQAPSHSFQELALAQSTWTLEFMLNYQTDLPYLSREIPFFFFFFGVLFNSSLLDLREAQCRGVIINVEDPNGSIQILGIFSSRSFQIAI